MQTDESNNRRSVKREPGTALFLSFEFARRVVRLARSLEHDKVCKVLIGQLLRSGTSVGANIEEAQGAQSRADFISKMSIARKEARETQYWLELFEAEGLLPPAFNDLPKSCDELVAILTAIIKSAQKNLAK